MDHHGLPRQALTWEPEGFRRRPGRPRQNWKDIVKKDLGKMDISWEDEDEAAEDRRSRRNRVAQCVFDAGDEPGIREIWREVWYTSVVLIGLWFVGYTGRSGSAKTERLAARSRDSDQGLSQRTDQVTAAASWAVWSRGTSETQVHRSTWQGVRTDCQVAQIVRSKLLLLLLLLLLLGALVAVW